MWTPSSPQRALTQAVFPQPSKVVGRYNEQPPTSILILRLRLMQSERLGKSHKPKSTTSYPQVLSKPACPSSPVCLAASDAPPPPFSHSPRGRRHFEGCAWQPDEDSCTWSWKFLSSPLNPELLFILLAELLDRFWRREALMTYRRTPWGES